MNTATTITRTTTTTNRMRRTLKMCSTHRTATCTMCRATRTSAAPPTCTSRCSRPSLDTASQALQRPATHVSSILPPSTLQANAPQAGVHHQSYQSLGFPVQFLVHLVVALACGRCTMFVRRGRGHWSVLQMITRGAPRQM